MVAAGERELDDPEVVTNPADIEDWLSDIKPLSN